MSSVQIRKAVAEDRDFLIKAILEADKSNTELSSYSRLLDMSESELKELFLNIFDEELETCEFGHSGFAIVVDNSNYAAAVSSWLEGADGLPSWQIKSTALFCSLPKENFERLQQKLNKFASINIPRTEGALQIESVFVENDFRGKGYFVQLLDFHIKSALQAGFDFNLVELLTYNSNSIAETVYKRAGFTKVKSTLSDNPEILNYYPGSGMNLWQKTI